MSQITDQVKERVDIVEVVQEYVPGLKKAGTNWKAPCPFHQEKTPSFMVSSQKQIWHCFGCGKGGDVYGFIKEIEGVEFADALRLLAKRAGITLEKKNPKEENERTRVLDILKHAARWYHQALLKAKSGEHARTYVTERGIQQNTSDTWQIGFAPDAWEGLLQFLQSRGYRNEEIEKTGLIIANDRGGFYDRFRNRLMFPITDAHGSVVGFTGRKLNDEDVGGKYINTPETMVYHKSEVLFGSYYAKQAIRTEDLAVVVEGNMDCVSSHQAGVAHVVAASGTALTPEQVKLLKRYTKNIALAFDPDKAGQEALMRGISIAWKEDMHITIIPLPDDKDPDDVIRESADAWKQAITERVGFMDWLFTKAEKEHDLQSAEGKKNFTKVLLPWVGNIPDVVEQTHYVQLLSAKVHVEEETLRSVMQPRKTQAARHIPEPVATPKKNMVQQAGIRLLALHVTTEQTTDIPDEWLPDTAIQTLYKNRNILYDSHATKDPSALIDTLDDSIRGVAREVLLVAEELIERTTPEERDRELGDLVKRLKQTYLKTELSSVRQHMHDAEITGDTEHMQSLLANWQRLHKELHDS